MYHEKSHWLICCRKHWVSIESQCLFDLRIKFNFFLGGGQSLTGKDKDTTNHCVMQFLFSCQYGVCTDVSDIFIYLKKKKKDVSRKLVLIQHKFSYRILTFILYWEVADWNVSIKAWLSKKCFICKCFVK